MPNVEYVAEELSAVIPQYDLITDCIAGGFAIKAKGTKYLPMPNATDQSPENTERYNAYKLRAQFYNVAQRTLNGFVGQIFAREPNAKVPPLLDVLIADIDGAGVTLAQQAKTAAANVLAKGRAGLYVDYPNTEGKPATVAEVKAGNIRPTINLYRPEAVINWRTKARGAKSILSLVVLAERALDTDDGFEPKFKDQWRVLRLTPDDKFVVELYDETNRDIPREIYFPTDSKGANLDEIPFLFLGAEKNDPSVEAPPMFALCDLNVGHYRNSADHEENLYQCGQATPVISGLTEEWAKNVLGGKVMLGARAAVMLPTGGEMTLLQTEERSAILAEMEHKERQMIALGAKLVEQKQVQRTATEASQEEAAESSTLSSVAKNISAGYKWALEWAAIFVGLSDRTATTPGTKGAIEFDLNTEFDLTQLTPEERKTLLAEWQANAITLEEYRDNLLRAGVATLPLEEFRTQIEKEAAEALERSAAETERMAAAETKGSGGPTPPAE